MIRDRPILRFVLLFFLAYGLLIAPWPGWRKAYAAGFRAFAAAVFGNGSEHMIVRVRPAELLPRPEIDTELLLAARSNIGPDGSGPASVLGLDSRGVGWVPTGVFIALTLATPVSWWRRVVAMGLGLLAIHTYLALLVGAFLWNKSQGMAPVTWLGFWPWLGDFLEETLVTQMGPSFVVPVIIWLLTMLPRRGLAAWKTTATGAPK